MTHADEYEIEALMDDGWRPFLARLTSQDAAFHKLQRYRDAGHTRDLRIVRVRRDVVFGETGKQEVQV